MQRSNDMNISGCPWWAKITHKKGSSRLYVKLYYHGHYREWSTGRKDEEKNRLDVKMFVEAINHDLAADSFVFEKAFPGASEGDKAFFAEKEGRTYTAPPEAVTFGQAYKVWEQEVLSRILSDNTKADYRKAIDPHILPYFGGITFDQITNRTVKDFLSSRFKYGDPNLGLVSQKRMHNIMIPLTKIWKDTIKKRGWLLESPFDDIDDYIKRITTVNVFNLTVDSTTNAGLLEKLKKAALKKNPINHWRVILFSEYLKIREKLDSFYRPAADMILLTGLSASELAGINKLSVENGILHISWSIVDGKIKDTHKTPYRTRKIPATKAIMRTIEIARAQNPVDAIFPFLRKSGKPFNNSEFRKKWQKACVAAGVPYVVPYALRHCFVAYCEQMGINEPRIIGLMGHADKSMIDKIYGKYVNGLEKDLENIKLFYGEDFYTE